MAEVCRSPMKGGSATTTPSGSEKLNGMHKHGSSFASTATTTSLTTIGVATPFNSFSPYRQIHSPGEANHLSFSPLGKTFVKEMKENFASSTLSVRQINADNGNNSVRPPFARRRSHRRTDDCTISFSLFGTEMTPSEPPSSVQISDENHNVKENAGHRSSTHKPSVRFAYPETVQDENCLKDPVYSYVHDDDNCSVHSDIREEDFANNPLPYEDLENPTTELLCAISSQDWMGVIRRVRQTLDDDATTSLGMSDEIRKWGHVTVRGQPVRLLPLQLACTLNPPVHVIQALVDIDSSAKEGGGKTASCPDRNGRLALHWACEANGSDPRVIRFLININPEACRRKEDIYGFLPLHIACFRHDLNQVIGETSESSRNGEGSDSGDEGPCVRPSSATFESSTLQENSHFAPGVVQALLESHPEGAAVRDDMGWMPLHLVCRTNPDGEPLVRLLLNACPEAAQARDRDGRLPLHWACCHRFSRLIGREEDDLDTMPLNEEFVKDPAEAIVDLLLDMYPDGVMGRERNYGFLPLHTACASGASLGVIRRLFEAFPEAARKQDKNGSLPVHIACRANASMPVVQSLIDAFPEGAQFQDADSRLPLHWACHVGASEGIISALLSAFPEGAQLTEAKYGYLPLHVACKRGAREDVVASLLAAFPEASRTRDDTGNLPLHIACGCKEVTEAVIGLLLLSFPEALERTDQQGFTPLMLAQREDGHNKDVIIGLLQSQPSGWRDLAFPIKLKFLDFAHNPTLERNVMEAIQRDHEENKNSLLSTEINTEDEHDSDVEEGHWGIQSSPSDDVEDSEDKQRVVLPQIMKCVVCLNRPVTHILYPCGHPCLCEQCVETHVECLNNICPVGRCHFHDTIRVYGRIIGE